MPNYRRAKFEGGYYFFTVVTYQRRKLFTAEFARECLRQAIDKTRSERPFEVVAFCLLPEHLHCIWKLPENDADFSMRWASIKGLLSREYRRRMDRQGRISPSRERKGEVTIWQRRFWEHQIRDEDDLQRHVDYIHYNPIKHGLVKDAQDWPWSTYHRYVMQGFYGTPNPFDKIQAFDDGYTFGE
ncbi:REP-associated tyrosine transposase [subsurface metagenome]